MSDAAKFDPHRRLCPDGNCIGIIGSDGRCRVCGRSASGAKDELPPEGFVPPSFDDDDDDGGDDADEEAAAGASEAAPTSGKAAFDPKRRLCPDGECLGVIGADGVCNVCGKKAD
ncbi:MAG TPA: hypothetical protein VKQ32_02600 [Polyangia bacterium]|nr:hypothetical protein [Polyangia bacterium]